MQELLAAGKGQAVLATSGFEADSVVARQAEAQQAAQEGVKRSATSKESQQDGSDSAATSAIQAGAQNGDGLKAQEEPQTETEPALVNPEAEVGAAKASSNSDGKSNLSMAQIPYVNH